MSRYMGLGYPATDEGKAGAKTVYDKTNINKPGSRYRGGRSGNRSLFDTSEYARMELDYYNKYSVGGVDDQAGVYNLKVVGEDGDTAVPNAIMNIGGRKFNAGADGRLRILDSEYLNSEIAAYKETQDYETKIVQAILVDDETARLIIGGSKAEVAELLNVDGGGSGKTIKIPGLTDGKGELNVDARPSAIRYLDPSGSAYARAVAKIRVIVHARGIIINEEGGNLSGSGIGTTPTKVSGNDAA